jgi:hypothetical protein
MTGGTALSERERERQTRAGARQAAAGPRGWAKRRCGRRRAYVGRLVGPDRGKKRNRPEFVFVFLFQINE